MCLSGELAFLRNEREIDHEVDPPASNPELSPKTLFAAMNFFLDLRLDLDLSYLNCKV